MLKRFIFCVKKIRNVKAVGSLLTAIMLLNCTPVNDQTVEAAINITPKTEKTELLKLVRISWDLIPGAVSYNLVILKNPADSPSKAVVTQKRIFNNGFELDTYRLRDAKEWYWSVCPVNYQGIEFGDYTEPKPLSEQEWNPRAPKPTTQFDDMAFSPLYPVYSWIPSNKAHSYQIQINLEDPYNKGSYKTIRTLSTGSNVYYEDGGYTWPGHYQWRVRALNDQGVPCTDWSVPSSFDIVDKAKVAALGDSITHGGGVSSVPPSYTLYNWETYCKVPIKNLGISGDTVQNMNSRFESEVLPFAPQILVIMGGVNNFRAGENAWETIDAMERIRDKCHYYHIVPVFATATPINEVLISHVPTIGTPAHNWKYEQQVLNCWIKQQQYWVDVTPPMTGTDGRLKPEMTTDGLHPDMEGKKIIGEMIGEYLLKTFPNLNLTEK